MEKDECGKCWIQINYEFMMDNSTFGIAAMYIHMYAHTPTQLLATYVR